MPSRVPSSAPPPPAATHASERSDGPSPGNRLLLLSLLLTLLLWNVPYGHVALYPFKLFATWLHEFSHGLAMIACGAGFARMEIFQDTSGLAFPSRAVAPYAQALISSAGYLGTAFFGAALLVVGRTQNGARRSLFVLGVLHLGSAAGFVRNPFGIMAVGLFGVLLLAVAFRAGMRACGFLVNLLAAQSCTNAVLDIRVLFGPAMLVNGRPHGQSDAHVVARSLGGPYWLWAGLWLTWSFVLFYSALRYVKVKGAAHATPVPPPLPALGEDGSARF
ncbi:MAG: M50 family metallopeptidase [Deltaproteobacteria bacterium]|nr:M50 family metallopeptidase [Deltaproteobacteria bacterium]